MPLSRCAFLRALCAFAVLPPVTTAPAHARLGETVAQIEMRYHDPVEKPTRRGPIEYRRYNDGTYAIIVAFLSGRSASEHITCKDGVKFTDADVTWFLTKNAPEGATWKKATYELWICSDNDRRAIQRTGQILISTAAFRQKFGQRDTRRL